jgi:predicted kinase
MGALIFVEGVPGSGKSTTAQFIARQLASHGRPARWIYEQEHPHPLVPGEPVTGYRSWDEFTDVRVDRWQAFAAAIARGSETVIVDGALLQLPVFSMLRRNAERPAVERLVNRLAGTVESLHPHLVCLVHRDPAKALRAVGIRRGAAWVAQQVARADQWEFTQTRGLAGVDAVPAFWKEHGGLCDDIMATLPMKKTVVDVAEGTWPARRREICAAFGVGADERVVASPDDVRAVIGRYRSGPHEVTVDTEDGRLVLHGRLWPTNALLPVSRHVFDVEAWPYQVTFEDDAGGAVRVMRWSTPRLEGGPAGAYTRDG